ncbi:MAG: flagellar basal body P-ring protein FlgI [Planctomycetota bacterium]
MQRQTHMTPRGTIADDTARGKPRRHPQSRRPRAAVAVATLGILLLGACSSRPPARVTRPSLPPVDAPAVLRGTLGTQIEFFGIQPTLVSGIGFVVGLPGTGGQVLDERIAGSLERQMGLMGVGREGAWTGTALEGLSPRQVLSDPNTAAVVVTAAIPPGTPSGRTFDVFVRALNASSLEGGRLWTTDLRLGPPTVFGSPTARIMGRARGEIYTNPFVEGGTSSAVAMRPAGRVLGGGTVTEALQIEARLRNPSHGRARLIVNTINSRFPQRAGDRLPTASGRDDASIALSVPHRYLDRSAEFIQILRHMQIDNSFPQIYAKRYTDALITEPYLAGDLAWALQALDEPALPFMRELYDHPEIAPRFAALQAGAGLGDPLSAPHLIELARTASSPAIQSDAIALLARVDAGPTVDLALRDLAALDTLTIRVAAYEALAERAEREQARRLAVLDEQEGLVATGRLSVPQLELLAASRLPAGTLQAVSRLTLGEFQLDRVPFGEPMIYVTQQRTPRVVLFGDDLRVNRPSFVSAWNNRFLLVAEDDAAPVRLRYESDVLRSRASALATPRRVVEHEVDPSITDLVDLLSHTPSPEDPRPGFGMNYSEVVGTLYALRRGGATNAAFATENDRLTADILSATEGVPVVMRPENEGDEEEIVIVEGGIFGEDVQETTPRLTPAGEPTLVVPINRDPTPRRQ